MEKDRREVSGEREGGGQSRRGVGEKVDEREDGAMNKRDEGEETMKKEEGEGEEENQYNPTGTIMSTGMRILWAKWRLTLPKEPSFR